MNEEIILNIEQSSPYVVGARAYVTQTEEGAVITITDKEGTTTATVLNGVDGRSISSITLNDDYTLTILYTDGTTDSTASIRGETGASGVYCGEEEPTDPDVVVWVDPSGGDSEDGSVLRLKEDDEWKPIPSIVGEAAGFGTVTATVDANHGVPSVTVTATGDDTAKNFAFDFKNLQPAPYDDSVIQARMDSFTHLTEGSTTGDAELIDGRVGADGVTYANIGGAIRGQITDVKSEISYIRDGEDVISNLIQGTYTTSDNVVSATNRLRTPKGLIVHKGDIIYFKPASTITHMYYGLFTLSGSFRSEDGWFTTETEITIKETSRLVLLYKNTNNITLVPSDYDATTVIKYLATNRLDNLEASKMDAFTNAEFTEAGQRIDTTGAYTGTTNMYATKMYLCSEGDTVEAYGRSFIYNGVPELALIAFYDSNKRFISSINSISGETSSKEGAVSAVAPANTSYVAGSTNSNNGDIDGYYLHVFSIAPSDILENIYQTKKAKEVVQRLALFPTISNGSGGNPANANFVTARAIPLNGAFRISYKNSKEVKAAGNYYLYTISAFKGADWYTDRLTDISADVNGIVTFDAADVINYASGVDSFGITIKEYDSTNNIVTIRSTDFSESDLFVRFVYSDAVDTIRELDIIETSHKLLNARHVENNLIAPLTLLHFSDLHADVDALTRIVEDGKKYANISNMICTGDIVSNTAQQIESWWDKSIMTCIGNHDTASYSDGSYNWTALSMADRDAYYIAPFESEWGITHTSGTSYYYKDYSAQKVRLIVMDVMLYNENGAEATAQTAWLTSLLADAITNNLHVLIAIHCPHGGATAKQCSFSKYGRGTMPTLTDCDTPQIIIDTVATAISNGLKFVGYIVGHTHQDNMWDARGDGKQMMYCVTCANTGTNAQWRGSDQDRSNAADAYNLVTIDTSHTLVKIIRGGGADIDDHMRTRKAICFDYSTGEMVGEVL